jgi:hypothetical protein
MKLLKSKHKSRIASRQVINRQSRSIYLTSEPPIVPFSSSSERSGCSRRPGCSRPADLRVRLQAVTCAWVSRPRGSSGVRKPGECQPSSMAPGDQVCAGEQDGRGSYRLPGDHLCAGEQDGRGSTWRPGCPRPVHLRVRPPASRSGGSSLACSWRSGCSPPVHLPARLHCTQILR